MPMRDYSIDGVSFTDPSSAPPGQSRAGVTLSTGCAREARASPVATPLRPVGAKTRTIVSGLSRAAKFYAATVAVVISDHGPFSPRVLIQRAM